MDERRRPAGTRKARRAAGAAGPSDADPEVLFLSRRLRMLNRIAASLPGDSGIEAVVREAAGELCAFLGILRCTVVLFGDPDVIVEHRGPAVASSGQACARFPRAHTGAGRELAAAGRPVVAENVRGAPHAPGAFAGPEEWAIGALLGIPVRAAGEPLGALFLDFPVGHAWTERELSTAEAVADQVAFAARLANGLEERKEPAGPLLSLMNNVPGVVYRGLRDWSLTFVGAEVERVTGYGAKELIEGRVKWPEIVHPDDLEHLKAAFRGAVSQQRAVLRVEYRIRRREGALRWLEDRRQLFYDAGGAFTYVDGLLLDITDGKHLEEELRGSEYRFRAIVDNATDGIVSTDRDGVITFVNAAAERQFGYRSGALIGEKVELLIPERHRAGHAEGMRRYLETGEARVLGRTVELHGLRRDGSEFPVELSLAAWKAAGETFFTATLRDSTLRKKAEEALRSTNQTLAALIEASPVSIMALDAAGRVTRWNPAAESTFGWTAEEVIGGDNPMIPEGSEDEFRTLLDRVLRGEGFSGVELRRRRKDGTPVDVLLSTAPLRDARGVTTGAMGVLLDITDRKRIEEALRQSEEQFRQSQKMEAVGRLAGGIAHDFNNLLTAIRGYSELLLKGLDGGAPHRREVEEIQKAADRAASLTQQLLAFSRKQVLQPRVLDLNDVVANMDAMLRRLIGEDLELVTVLRPDLWTVRVDAGQFEQVLMNLAVNAKDAMPKGGTLTIETANVEVAEGDEADGAKTPAGPCVMLRVSDTGCGMDEETRGRIFEPFFTTKEQGKGTGLGLSTVYGIVRQSRGRVRVTSEPGIGTAVAVFVPKFGDAAAEPFHETTQSGAPPGRETVLVVEDEAMVRELVEKVLADHGYTVLAASDGGGALEVAGRHEGTIDLLVTDVVMPRMGGRELAARLACRRPGLRVLYMSGHTDTDIVHDGMLDPETAFLQKPFRLDALLRKVREVIRR